MLKKIIFTCLCVWCLNSQIAKAEEHALDNIDSDLGLWPTAEITFPVYKDKVSGYFFTSPIVIDADNKMDVNPLILRSAIIANPTPNTRVWLGYDRNADLTSKADFKEHRIWQQVTQKHTFKKYDRLTVNHRFRAEERILENIGTAIRLRYRAGATLGLGKTRKWYLVANDEILFYANQTTGRDAGFSENRTFLGIGRKLTPNISLEFGWQPSLINSSGAKHDIFRNYIVTAVSIKIPYKKAIKKPF